MKIATIIVLVVLAVILIVLSAKARNKKKYFYFYLLSGLAVYIVCCISGVFYKPLQLEVNMFNISVSTLGGVPGVAFLYGLKYLL